MVLFWTLKDCIGQGVEKLLLWAYKSSIFFVLRTRVTSRLNRSEMNRGYSFFFMISMQDATNIALYFT